MGVGRAEVLLMAFYGILTGTIVGNHGCIIKLSGFQTLGFKLEKANTHTQTICIHLLYQIWDGKWFCTPHLGREKEHVNQIK